MTRERHPAGAERRANRELALAAVNAHGKEIRDVRAGDQQHEADAAEKHP